MFGLGEARRKSGRRAFNVAPREIPGFSKWIASEMYTESRLVELTLDKLALVMEESERELNERLDLIVDTVMEEVTEDEQSQVENDADSVVSGDDKEVSLNDTVGINDVGLTTLLLKSPSKAKRSSSPQREIQEMRLELINATTNLLISSPKAHKLNTVDTVTDTVADTDGEIDIDDRLKKSANDSFEAISRQIRKSFVNKTRPKSSESPTFSHTVTGETESTDPNLGEAPAPEGSIIGSKEATSPEKEVAEISRLIENAESGLDNQSDVSDFENDLSIDIGPLEKIDIQVRKSEGPASGADITRSPIKFYEIPTREPIVVDSIQKSARKSGASVATRMNSLPNALNPSTMTPSNANQTSKRMQQHITTPAEEESVFIDKSSTKIDRHNYQLHLPPGRFASSAQETSPDEPTIRINRKVRRPQEAKPTTPVQRRGNLTATKSLPHMNIPLVESSPQLRQTPVSSKHLVERLMKPTQSSLKRQRESPTKSDLVNSSTLSRKERENVDSPTTVLVPLKDHSTIEPISIVRSQSLGSGLSPQKSKRSIPLTMKPLKSTDGIRKSSGTSTKLTPPRKLLIHSMNKVGVEMPGTSSNKRRTERVVSLKKPSIPTAISGGPPAGTKTTIVTPDDLPEIESGAEDEEAVCLSDWGARDRLRSQLRAQSKTNPVDVFGTLESVNCETIFGQRYSTRMNIQWREGDALSARELASYERVMGWRV